MNFDKLKETEHMLQQFSNEPFKEIAARVEQMFIQQSPTTKLLDFIVTTEPQWLTSVKGNSDDQVVLVKAGEGEWVVTSYYKITMVLTT